jgi:putative flippase GtrA
VQAIKYIFSGLVNTVIGYSVFLTLITLFTIRPEYANAVGYGVALVAAFILNKIFVFDQSKTNRSTIPKFIAAFIAAFSLNQLILFIANRIMGMQAETAQVFAMISYTVSFYFLNKNFVFSSRKLTKKPIQKTNNI